jgi:predicted phage tail protein
MLKEIRLYGWLGDRYGKVHHLAVNSLAEALKALQANYPGFAQDLVDYPHGYKVWTGTTRVTDAKDVVMPVSYKEIIRIAPAVAGADDDGLFSIAAGAFLIWATWGTGGFATGSLFGMSAGATTMVANIGVSLVMGGIAQMLMPSPTRTAQDIQEAPENKPSYLFRGAVNTTAQGHPVPVGYGRLIVGSAVISAGISTSDT